MRELRFISLPALLLVLTLPCSGCVSAKDCTFSPQLTSASPAIPEGFGVNIHFTDPRPGEIKLLAEGGFRWVRMDFKWDETEKEPGVYDFSAYDRLLAALDPYGIHALFILDYGNPLYDKGAPPRTERSRQAFARWAVAAAKHFSGRGVLWEIYNEPNISTFWPPLPNAQEYIGLALVVGRALREAVPDEKLIGPATSQVDFAFLESCFKAGLLEYWAAVSIHPYRRNDPESAAQDYCRLRDLIKTYAPMDVKNPTSKAQGPMQDRVKNYKETPIISSEWGYSSVWPGMSEEKQGQLLARSWLTNVANHISLSIWYDWRDDGIDPREAEDHFGTVSHSYRDGREPVYEAKPAFLAAKTLTAFFSGYRFEKRLDGGSAEDYVLSFRKGGEVRFAAWTTADGVHRIQIPSLTAGRYQSIRHTGQSDTDVTADEKGLAITLRTAPVYLRSY